MSAIGADLPRMAGLLFGLIALQALIAGGTRVAMTRAGGRTWDGSAMIAAVITVATITGSAMLLGAFGVLSLAAWLAMLLVAGMAMLIASRVRVGGPDAAGAAPDAAPSRIFAAAIGGLAIAQMVFVTRNPPADRDSLTYHLPMAVQWFMTHSLGAPLRFPPESATYYPGNLELVQLLPMWIAHDDLYVGLVNIACLWLLALAVRRLAVDLGARNAVAEAVALLVATTPVCALLVKGLSADAAMATFVVIALVLLVRWRARGQALDMALALLALGFVAGCRFTGPAYAAVIVALAWLAPGRAKAARLAPLWAWALALALGGFWLVRNTIAIGNPFYPAEAQLLGRTLPGTLPLTMLRRTTQIATWREGFAGQLTLANLLVHYRAGLLIAMAGIAALALPAARRAIRDAWTPAGFALAASALYLVSFYSGANLPSQHGEPPMLASGNVRYLLPAFAAACAMVAPALGALIPAAILAPLLGVASVAQMAPLWSRIGIALTVAAILYAAGASRFATRLAPRVVASVLIAVVLILAPSHAKIEARIWDGYASRLTLLPSSLADSLRREAHGRTIATTGLDGSWQVVGSRLEGRPAYVPIQRSWTQARSMWDFTPDDRTHGDRERWLANLRAADAAFVAIGWSDTSAAPVESLWCASDSTRFTARSLQPHRLVFAVR